MLDQNIFIKTPTLPGRGRKQMRLAGELHEINKTLECLCITAKSRSKRIKMPEQFNLTIEYLHDLYNKQGGKCYYTGWQMSAASIGEINKTRTERINPFKISVDRLDSTKGYSTDNVVLCCAWVNRAKGTATHKQFIDMCKAVVAMDKQSRR